VRLHAGRADLHPVDEESMMDRRNFLKALGAAGVAIVGGKVTASEPEGTALPPKDSYVTEEEAGEFFYSNDGIVTDKGVLSVEIKRHPQDLGIDRPNVIKPTTYKAFFAEFPPNEEELEDWVLEWPWQEVELTKVELVDAGGNIDIKYHLKRRDGREIVATNHHFI
jgi:hypothetical protein